MSEGKKPDSETMRALRTMMNSTAKMANLSKLDVSLMDRVCEKQDDLKDLEHVTITLSINGQESAVLDELPCKTLMELCRCDWVVSIAPSSHATLCSF